VVEGISPDERKKACSESFMMALKRWVEWAVLIEWGGGLQGISPGERKRRTCVGRWGLVGVIDSFGSTATPTTGVHASSFRSFEFPQS